MTNEELTKLTSKELLPLLDSEMCHLFDIDHSAVTKELLRRLNEIDRLTAENERQELLITSLRQIIKERSDE